MSGEAITEYGQLMSGGGFHTFLDEPYIENIYPLADRVKAGMRFGGHVYRRRIVVVEDWEEITDTDVGGSDECGDQAQEEVPRAQAGWRRAAQQLQRQ